MSDRLTLFIFEKMSPNTWSLNNSFLKKCLPNTWSLNNYSLSVVFSNKNRVPQNRDLFNLQLKKSWVLFLEIIFILHIMQQKCLMHTSHFVLQNVKRYVLKWSRLNKVTFTPSSRIFFSETGFLFNCKYIVWRIQWLPVPLGTTIWGQQFSSPLLLHHQCFYNTGQKKANEILILLWK